MSLYMQDKINNLHLNPFIMKSEIQPPAEVFAVIPEIALPLYRPRVAFASKWERLDRNGGGSKASSMKCWCIAWIKTYCLQDNVGKMTMTSK